MNRVKYLILGAGPAGLSLANKLKQLGEESFLVLEKEKMLWYTTMSCKFKHRRCKPWAF